MSEQHQSNIVNASENVTGVSNSSVPQVAPKPRKAGRRKPSVLRRIESWAGRIALVVGLLGVSVLGVISAIHGEPKLFLRVICDENQAPVICGREGMLVFGLGTYKTGEVSLQELRLEFDPASGLEVHTDDVFKAVGMSKGNMIQFAWKETGVTLHKGDLLLVSLAFRARSGQPPKVVPLVLTAIACVPPHEFSFPLSLFPPSQRKQSSHLKLEWKEEWPQVGGMLVKTPERVCYYGKMAQQALAVSGAGLQLRVLELFKDGTSKVSDITTVSPTDTGQGKTNAKPSNVGK